MEIQPAASEWIRFDPDNITALHMPRAGEWCLWSFVTESGREYYSGSWFDSDGQIMVRTEYGWARELRDAYFAMVNPLPEERPQIIELPLIKQTRKPDES